VARLEQIPHSRPTLNAADQQAARAVLRTGQVAQGPEVARFEARLARRVGCRGGVATSSGTAALHLTLLALGVKPDDEVILPSYTCAAVAHAVRQTGARPVTADVGDDLNLSLNGVKARLTRRTKAIIAVHLFGMPADIPDLVRLGLPVIEDCAQALGAKWGRRPCGRFGVASVFSFYATKVITTGEGGMVCSDSSKLLDRIRDRREYDRKSDRVLRYNYKMTDLAAALGLSQLARLSDFLRARRARAKEYTRCLASLDCELPRPGRHRQPIYYRYVIRKKGLTDDILNRFHRLGIRAERPVFQPLHRMLRGGRCPAADAGWRSALSLPIYPSLSRRDQRRVIAAARAILGP